MYSNITNISTTLRKEYEHYKLNWMIDHDITTDELFNLGMKAGVEDNYTDYTSWEYEEGFGGSLWSGYSEWLTEDAPIIFIDELWSLVRIEDDIELSNREKNRYLQLVDMLNYLGIEIPFGIEI
jgi:hypothetical protein